MSMDSSKPVMTQSAVSFWQYQQKEAPQSEPLKEDVEVDVAIIGGGFTGLSAAREIRKDEPSHRVTVLEANMVGYGASGRNGGFNMSLFGLEPEVTLVRWGKQKTIDAQHYMIKAVDYVRNLVDEYDLPSDYEHPGMVRVAYSDRQRHRLEDSLELFEKLGLRQHYQFKNAREIQESIHSPRFQAGLFEQNSGILNPYKHVRALKKLAQSVGANVYENTPVTHITHHKDKITLFTPQGSIRCDKLIIAVNAWASQIRGLPRIRSRQAPVWTAQVVTAPLSEQQWQDIGWSERESIEDNRQLLHYFRRTVCGRFTMGGGAIAFPQNNALGQMETQNIWDNLETHIQWLFPQLKGIAIDYRWGGPVSINMDMTPEIGFIGDERIIYATGCMGHGVSLTQLNGRTIADLVLEKKTELTDFWIINRKAIPWPPGLLGQAIAHTIAGGLKLWDKFEERSLKRHL